MRQDWRGGGRLAAAGIAVTLLMLTSVPATLAAGAEATAVKLSRDGNSTVFSLQLSRGLTAEVFTLANPYRVIVDLPDVDFRLPATAGRTGDGLVTAFRYGLFAERKARVVIDTKGPVRIGKAFMDRGEGSGVMLNVVLEPTDAASFGAGTGATWTAEHAPRAAAPAQLPDANTKRKRSKPVIVIDPGHGGIDPGATGANSTSEKTVVLAVGLKLRETLAATGRYVVEMTRSSDVFVSLDNRLRISEQLDADLFVSLHADAIEEKTVAENIRGATIYTLSESASDEQARLMAEKENASDILAGLEAADTPAGDQVRNILIDLLKRETANFSADFSNVLSRRLGKTIAMSRVSRRSAAFKVLKQPHAPSVLIELGYMSNSSDQRQMETAEWQAKVAGSITSAIDTYFSKRTAEHP